MYRATFAVVDGDALHFNLNLIRHQIAPATRLLMAVKANAYGHGAVQTCQMAIRFGVTDFGVASLEEALELREAGIKAPILVLGAIPPHGARVAAEANVLVTVGDDWETVVNQVFPKPLGIHVKVDTGMTRLGITAAEDVIAALQSLRKRADIRVEGLYTHFAAADAEDLTHVHAQADKFAQIVRWTVAAGLRPPIVHTANSAATFVETEWHYDMVRVGINAYGYPARRNVTANQSFRPVLSLYSCITRITTIPIGQGVGYGVTFRAQRPTRVATLAVGYADGYPRFLSNQGWVLLRGQNAPVIGRVCMDQLMVDVTDIPEASQGDCVTLYGREAPSSWQADKLFSVADLNQMNGLVDTWKDTPARDENLHPRYLSLDDLAPLGQTISYEILCALSGRVPRVYVTL